MAPPVLRSSRTRPTRLVIPLTAALGALYLALRYGAFPGSADVPILDVNPLDDPPFSGFTGVMRPFSGADRHREPDHHSGGPARRPPRTGTTARFHGLGCKSAAAHLSVRRRSRTACHPARGRHLAGRSEWRSAVAMTSTGDRPYRSLRGALHSVTVVLVLPEAPDGAAGDGLRGPIGSAQTELVWSGRRGKDRAIGLIAARTPPAMSPVGNPRLGE